MSGSRCLDLGAGIGRVAKGLLQSFFTYVDLVDQNEVYLKKARDSMGTKNVKYQVSALQGFKVTEMDRDYNCFWIQYALMYLMDDDVVDLLSMCSNFRHDDESLIIVKDNVVAVERARDSKAVHRTKDQWFALFVRAGLQVVDDRK